VWVRLSAARRVRPAKRRRRRPAERGPRGPATRPAGAQHAAAEGGIPPPPTRTPPPPPSRARRAALPPPARALRRRRGSGPAMFRAVTALRPRLVARGGEGRESPGGAQAGCGASPGCHPSAHPPIPPGPRLCARPACRPVREAGAAPRRAPSVGADRPSARDVGTVRTAGHAPHGWPCALVSRSAAPPRRAGPAVRERGT
jgi:hypothetical protein